MSVSSFLTRFVAFVTVFAFILGPQLALADDIDLPSPQTEGGLGLFEALKKRSSVAGGDFSLAEVTKEELSTILWSASGLNRGQTGWTVPMAEGLPPYVKIYVAGQEGLFRYDWAGHKLLEISKENIKAKIGGPRFITKAYYVLILTTDKEILGRLVHGGQNSQDEFANVLVGSMTQDIYLAAAALNLGTRYIHSMNKAAVSAALQLDEKDYPIALMLLGK
jgi:nitroreductase